MAESNSTGGESPTPSLSNDILGSAPQVEDAEYLESWLDVVRTFRDLTTSYGKLRDGLSSDHPLERQYGVVEDLPEGASKEAGTVKEQLKSAASVSAQTNIKGLDLKDRDCVPKPVDAKDASAGSVRDHRLRDPATNTATTMSVRRNKELDSKRQIRVFCAIRPLLNHVDKEAKGLSYRILSRETISSEFVEPPDVGTGISIPSRDGKKHQEFEFDGVFGPSSPMDLLSHEVRQMIQGAADGYDISIICYGQTGTGKTHLLEHPEHGLIAKCLLQLLGIRDPGQSDIGVSIVEIYRKHIRDIVSTEALGNGNRDDSSSSGKQPRGSVRLTEYSKGPGGPGRFAIQGAQEIPLGACSAGSAVSQVLSMLAKSRRKAPNVSHPESSRSHCFVIVKVRDQAGLVRGTLKLVDLAGSEAGDIKAGLTGSLQQKQAERLLEMQEINKDLEAFRRVVLALHERDKTKRHGDRATNLPSTRSKSPKRTHIPYGDSKLTKALSDCLGGALSKTLLIATVSPAASKVSETIKTLEFAQMVGGLRVN